MRKKAFHHKKNGFMKSSSCMPSAVFLIFSHHFGLFAPPILNPSLLGTLSRDAYLTLFQERVPLIFGVLTPFTHDYFLKTSAYTN